MRQISPQEAREINKKRREEATAWQKRVDLLITSVRALQKENGFAPRMELAYRSRR